MMERVSRRCVGFGHRAGADEGAELVVGERLDQRRYHAGCLDAGERVSGDLAAGGEPGGEAADGELADAGGAGCGAGVEQAGDPGVEGGAAHRLDGRGWRTSAGSGWRRRRRSRRCRGACPPRAGRSASRRVGRWRGQQSWRSGASCPDCTASRRPRPARGW